MARKDTMSLEDKYDPDTLKDPLPVDKELWVKSNLEGGFSTSISFKDLQRLRKIVKRYHMAHYPDEMLTDYEADRIIDVLAPETQRYLIERTWEQMK